MTRFTIILAAGLLSSAAHAVPARDVATGLAVNPPPGYAVRAEAPDQQHAARFSLRLATDTDGGCQLGFAPVPANARLQQQHINTAAASTAGQDAAKAALAPVYDVIDARVANFGAVRGMELQADFKPRRELPPRARELRSYFAILETPRGRTTLACVAERGQFPARLPGFTAIAQGITAP